LIQFGPTEVEDYDEALSRIQQEGTWREYQQEFEQLAIQVDGWPQKTLMGTFLGGLKKDIVFAVRMFKPKTLRDAIELARMRDDNLSRDLKTTRGEGPKPQQTESFPKHNHSTMSTYLARYSTNTTRPYSSGAAKKLSWEETQKRREKNLCFSCNEKFTPGHRCQTPQAFSIGFLQRMKGLRSSKMATLKLWKVSAELKRLNPSSISTHEPCRQGSFKGG